MPNIRSHCSLCFYLLLLPASALSFYTNNLYPPSTSSPMILRYLQVGVALGETLIISVVEAQLFSIGYSSATGALQGMLCEMHHATHLLRRNETPLTHNPFAHPSLLPRHPLDPMPGTVQCSTCLARRSRVPFKKKKKGKEKT